jgi:5-methylcytosine-specific restriction endonuclease McrA
MRICSGAGCLRAVDDAVRFCPECQAERQPVQDDGIRVNTLADRLKYASLYSSQRWTRLRALVLRSQPMCSRCNRALTAIIDHVVPAGIAIVQASESGKYVDRYAGFFMRSNLQGLCRACHWQKTEEDKAHCGQWPNVVERGAHTAKRAWSF